jgi:phosphoribosylaminoimidazole synthetase
MQIIMTKNPSNKTTYLESGVNIHAGYELVERIKPLAKATNRAGVMGGIGGFGGLFDLKAAGYDDGVLVAATDGVGTKLKLSQATTKHDTIGIDLVAMCVNDLLAQAAEPLFFLDYFACGALDVGVAAEVISGIAKGCELAGCALIGGETAEMPSIYAAGEYDLAGFAVGAAKRDGLLPNKASMQEGDALIALASSGVHSNGYSLVRKLLEKQGSNYHDKTAWDESISYGETFLIPTRIYVKSVLPLMRSSNAIKGFAHITGGGLTENLPRILPEHLSAHIALSTWQMSDMFKWLQAAGGLDNSDMFNTFNCGIGAVLAVSKSEADTIIKSLQKAGENAWQIGEITNRTDKEIIYS